jgi:hypothetical protein
VFSLLAQLVSGGFLDLRFGGKKFKIYFVVRGLKRGGVIAPELLFGLSPSPLFAGIIEAGLILDPAHAAGGVLFACGSPLFAGIIEAGLHLDPSLCSG